VENQRVADLAAFAAATAYNPDSSVSITTIADNVASLNGVAPSAVTAALVTSPTGSGKQAVQVMVTITYRVHTAVPRLPVALAGGDNLTLTACFPNQQTGS